jgi:hypothetical protein
MVKGKCRLCTAFALFIYSWTLPLTSVRPSSCFIPFPPRSLDPRKTMTGYKHVHRALTFIHKPGAHTPINYCT